jgi:Flp pilus assembly protein TadG
MGVIQLGLVLHVRNTLTAAASEGARFAATADHTAADGADRARAVVADVLAGRYADNVTAAPTTVNGLAGVRVRIEADVPALGLGGPSVAVSVVGHAVEEQPP